MENTRGFRIAVKVAAFYFMIAGYCQTLHAQSEVRFRLVRDTVIVVSTTVNDQGPFDFVLDTGTNSTVVDPQLARRLSLTALDQIKLVTEAREMAVDRSSVRSFSMGPAQATDLEVLVQDLSQIRKVDSHIVGILGQNFLGQFNYLIDYKRRSIVVERGGELESGLSGTRTPVELNEEMMLVASEIQARNHVQVRLLLDSGANYLTLFHAASLGLNTNSQTSAWTANTGSDVNGVASGRIKLLTVGAQLFRNITAGLPSSVAADQDRVEDGSLPVAFFRTIYINNLKHYVVFNAERH